MRAAITSLGLPFLLQTERHVAAHGQMWIERIGLEHHGDAALGGRYMIDRRSTDLDPARRGLLESGNHAEQRGLATTRRTDEHHEFAVFDGEVDVFQDVDITEGLADIVER